ncbi:gastrula zinc finger protein XlCGF66.1-like isoform X3 [Bufo gargarizans]|uniref:gastrula zinc finger protein XlCGF66.1-like isoform X3 n=1 Tax=Bufo gargarizans TaxID=30331 RepID=UPI001CF43BBD|nr:gastrula zinc finger protein XlCGF66.1-like isoform X3 [Bufo gargarizans]
MMENGKGLITKRILDLTLEIIYILTGEESTVVKKTSGEPVTPSNCPHMSGVWNRTMSPVMEASSLSLIHEINNEQRILDLTNKIICLLTGEVPIRCQDVTVYFSMEEWEYIEEHQDVYKDIMMENRQPLISLDESSYENSPKRRPSLVNFQDGPDENHIVSQDEGFVGIKVEVIEGLEETYGTGDLQSGKKNTPTNSSKESLPLTRMKK